jgi:DNA primase catalytic core
MKRRVKNLEIVTESIKPFLNEYLNERGIDTSTNFSCINPSHNDENASMSSSGVSNGIYKAHCFGCGCTIDIFSAAHLLEGKPLKGPNFIEENVKYLANKFGQEIEFEDLTEAEVYEYKTYEAYRYASQLISDRSFGDYTLVDEEIKRRKWKEENCSEWGIGTVNHLEYKKRMKMAGYDVGFLAEVDLERSNLFDSHNMIFTIYDDYGRPIGFSARNLKYDGTKEAGAKYNNTRVTGLTCAIFKKGERLYGLEIAKTAPQPLYIFEGQGDVIGARHLGLKSCCCTLGSVLSEHHINLLKKHNLFNIVLVFDSDNAGYQATLKAIDDRFAPEKDFKVKLVQIPNGLDPEELMRDKGIDDFLRLKKFTAFEWRLLQFINQCGDDIADEEKRSEIATKMSPLIVSEKSVIKQEEMAKQIARYTGFELSTIMSEVRRLRHEKEALVHEKKKAIIESLLYQVKFNPAEAEVALAECQSAINDVNKESGISVENKSIIEFMNTQKEHDENRSGEFAGYKMRPEGLGNIAAKLDDDWSVGGLMFVGGGPQASKTTLCSQMAYEIATCNEDVICIYQSIDDAAKVIMYKWVCQAVNDLDLELNHVSNPNYYERLGLSVRDRREEGYKRILDLVRQNRLVLYDSSVGASLNYAESVIKNYQERFPGKKILMFIDNFHKLPDMPEISGHERTKRLSNYAKNITMTNNVTIVATAEYRKLEPGEKPSNLAMAESRALSYDATVILHLHNELHHATEEDEALLVHEHKGKTMPRIWCKFGKNKVSGYEGIEYLDLYPANATLKSIDQEVARLELRERKLMRKSSARK